MVDCYFSRISDWTSPLDFLEKLAKKTGKLLKGGEPDLKAVSKVGEDAAISIISGSLLIARSKNLLRITKYLHLLYKSEISLFGDWPNYKLSINVSDFVFFCDLHWTLVEVYSY